MNQEQETRWVIYQMDRDGQTLAVPIYDVKRREDEGWRRRPCNLGY